MSVVLVSVRVLKIKRRLTSSQFELREVRALRQTPSRSLEDLESDHAQRQTQLTPESHHSMNNYYTSITKVLPELEPRLSRNNLGNICPSKTPDKESFSRVAKFYKIDGKPSRKCTQVFAVCAD